MIETLTQTQIDLFENNDETTLSVNFTPTVQRRFMPMIKPAFLQKIRYMNLKQMDMREFMRLAVPYMYRVDKSEKDKKTFRRIISAYKPVRPISVPVRVNIDFYFNRLKKDFRANGSLKDNVPKFPTSIKHGDIDNLTKFVLDCMNGLFWEDDQLVIGGSFFKHYTFEQEKIVITYKKLT